ncbi:hypothetical protein EYR40_001653 [Pleurotus pulmonarius]|nr:hypothetical protein EYR40_001653 [Pleurotus pulmonarius]
MEGKDSATTKELRDEYRKVFRLLVIVAPAARSPLPSLLVDMELIDEKKLVSRRQLAGKIATSVANLSCLNQMSGQLSEQEEEKLEGLLRDCIREASAYAILSHRWEHEELEFSDLQRLDDEEVKGKQGFLKFDKFCAEAKKRYKCLYVWADTACIDKNSSTELDESIRSMYTWYRNAEVCLVYLSITDRSQVESLRHDDWFQRGWTLQELLAPKRLKFFCQDWTEVYPQCGAYDLIRTEDRWEDEADEVVPNHILRIIQNYMQARDASISLAQEAHARPLATTTDAPDASYDRNGVEASAETKDASLFDFLTLGGAVVTVAETQPTPDSMPRALVSPLMPTAADAVANEDTTLSYNFDDIDSDNSAFDKLQLPSVPKRYPSVCVCLPDWNLPTEGGDEVLERLAEITKIDTESLRHYQPNPAHARNVFQWVSGRETSRAEDMSYCLLGLLDIQMPIAYGEGPERAFFRLQVECIHFVEDRSLFLWNGPRSRWNSMFAGVPSAFKDFPKDPVDPQSLSSNHIFKHYQHEKGMDPSFSLTNCGLRIMVALHSVEFVSASTPPSGKHTYTLTLLDPADTEVTLRWQGETPSPETITERWKVAVVGGFNNNRAFTILLREGESRSPPRYHRWSSAVFTKAPPLDRLTGIPPKTVWIQ